MSRDDFRRRADAVRGIPLERVLLVRGATRDPADRSKWDTERGLLSITGEKFFDWRLDRGGGGAIDLVMHKAAEDCREAIDWLERNVAGVSAANRVPPARFQQWSPPTSSLLRLPSREGRMLAQVREYLSRRRHLSPELLEALLEAGRLYADRRGNAVFLLVAGKANRPVSAEMRGTGPHVWRGMAPGSDKGPGLLLGRKSRFAAHRDL